MGYRLDNKEIDITGKRLTKIATGATGDVYKYKNNALKIFKKDKETPIDVETATALTGISTNRILLPKNLLFYNNSFRGYTYKLVSKKGSGKRMIMLPKKDFIENITSLERDIEVLSNKKVLLNGVDPSNSIFNGNLYLTDPSKYTMLEGFSPDELERLNKYQLHLLLTSLITTELRKNNFPSNIERQVKELLQIKDDNDNSSNFFSDIIGNEDTLKQFIKKI